MKKYKILLKTLFSNGIVGVPTDTVYGLVAILNKNNIKKINILKERASNKLLQILINDIKQVEKMWIGTKFQKEYVKKNLNHKTSYIVESNKYFSNKYLNKNFNDTIMFRVVAQKELVNLINKTGPLFASSANRTGEEPLNSRKKVKSFFNIPVLKGKLGSNEPSSIISLLNDRKVKIR